MSTRPTRRSAAKTAQQPAPQPATKLDRVWLTVKALWRVINAIIGDTDFLVYGGLLLVGIGVGIVTKNVGYGLIAGGAPLVVIGFYLLTPPRRTVTREDE
jgi:hypothetical protein